MFNCVMIGGKFDDQGGKSSGYIHKLYLALSAVNQHFKLHNGGSFSSLEHIISKLQDFHVIFWMPDVPNDKEKLVLKIKTLYPHSVLITSKNNLMHKYSILEIISKALATKSNLFVVFDSLSGGPHNIQATIYDPLGNCYGGSLDIEKVAVLLINRIIKLLSFRRMNSVRVSDNVEYPVDVPVEFFDIVKRYAEVFHNCIHPVATTRLLGNASFRCESGFPSFKTETGDVFVTRRNIDKRDISIESFVPVCLKVVNPPDGEVYDMWEPTLEYVGFKGTYKPSVDTPIQLMLYRYYKNIKFMIHSHTYITNAMLTPVDCPIPCGAIEEFYEIVKMFPTRESNFVEINLSGHGSLVMSATLEGLKNINYMPRPMPEGHY
jgi:ribulose-5-phosphate 4-epimerase/fuculose-1-phosphate aldolase